MCNQNSPVLPGLPKWLESVRVNIGMPVVQTDGRAGGRSVGRSVYDHVITKFSRMGSLPHFLTRGAPQAREACQSSSINPE